MKVRKKVDAAVFIWRLVKRLVILGLILGIGWQYFNNPQFQQRTNDNVWQARQKITRMLGTSTATPTNGGPTTKPGQNPTDSQDTNGQPASQHQCLDPTTGRWPTNQATVYVNTGNQELDAATNSAIQAWNQTGAFHFQSTNDRQQANVVVSAMNNGQTDAAGLTDTETNPVNNRFLHANVYLNVHYLTDPLYGYSQQRIVNTAEHELGHAIGLDHTNMTSVMQPAGSFYSIQPVDVQSVQHLYGN